MAAGEQRDGVCCMCVCVCLTAESVVIAYCCMVTGVCELSKERLDTVWALICGVEIVSSRLPEGENTNTLHLPGVVWNETHWLKDRQH